MHLFVGLCGEDTNQHILGLSQIKLDLRIMSSILLFKTDTSQKLIIHYNVHLLKLKVTKIMIK